MSARPKASRRLATAAAATTLVRLERSPRYADRVDGFVVAVGRKWALLAATTDGGYFDGFVAVRVRDVRRVRRDRTFERAFAMTRPEWPPVAPGPVDLDSTTGLLRTLAATAPLIGIEKEHEREAIWIGTLVDVRRGGVGLREVRPDASWHRRPLWYERRAVTKVSVRTHYLTGLAVIAGEPPTR
jgi:hypothetical protein